MLLQRSYKKHNKRMQWAAKPLRALSAADAGRYSTKTHVAIQTKTTASQEPLGKGIECKYGRASRM